MRPTPIRPAARWLRAGLTALLAVQLTACGTLLYPERHGQARGRFDPAVLLLDGALLIAFIVPGLVAYAIDFHTGAIYLPGHRRAALPPDALTERRVRAIVLEQTGHDVAWSDPRLRVRPIASPASLASLAPSAGSTGPAPEPARL